MKKTKHLNCTWLRYRQLAKFSVVVKYGGAQSYWAREPQTVIWCPENQHRCFFQSNHGHHSIFYAMWFCFSGSWCCTKKKYCQYHKVVTYLNNWHNFQLHNAWTVKIIGEGSGPRGPLPGSTTFSDFDGPGVIYSALICLHLYYKGRCLCVCRMSS